MQVLPLCSCKGRLNLQWSCEDLEERSSRPRSGCRKNSKCEGCMHCVCFGCKMCRFEDCRCQVCVDFYSNAIYKLKLKKNVSNILKMKFQKQKKQVISYTANTILN
ncbi:putative developmental regulator, ULTRAPETALA [Helianthus annuus]|nr:putative developmental regulator, ULTRAPETALA [Helianthus annuus]